MEPTTMLALGSIGSSLLGGLFGKKSGDKNRAMQQAQFNAQMDQSIQRRVADARKAGVHPLFALGASVGASPTLTAGSSPMADAMQGVSSTLSQLSAQKSQKDLFEAQVAAAKGSAEKDSAMATYYNALAAKTQQDPTVNSNAALGVRGTAELPGIAMTPEGITETLPRTDTTRHPENKNVGAGAPPGFGWYTMPDGAKMLLPIADNPAEAFESFTGVGLGMYYTWKDKMRNRQMKPASKGRWLPKGLTGRNKRNQ